MRTIPEMQQRLIHLFADAGVTQTPQHGISGTQRQQIWSIVCQSIDTTAEIAARMPQARQEQYEALGVRGDDRPDEVTVTVGSWKQRPDALPDSFDAWIGHASKKIPAGYVPVRIVKGTTVKSSMMGPAELRSIRESVGYSIEDLTRELSVSRSIVQKWEAGNAPIPDGVAQSVEDMQDAYQDALDTALQDGGDMIAVPRTDAESWEATGRPARWWRQIAAEVRLEHGTRIEWAS